MKDMRVLVISAHPDDETCGMGGTIADLSAKGAEVYVSILTDGVRARHNECETQRDCARKACAILGARDVFLHDFVDQQLDAVPLIDLAKTISTHINDLQPQIVFSPPAEDVNQDHRAAFEATLVAVRPTPTNPVQTFYSYEVPSSTEWYATGSHAFTPNTFWNISETVETKMQAMKAYDDTHQSELKEYPHPRSLEALRAYAQHHGSRVGLAYAEAFCLVRDRRGLL